MRLRAHSATGFLKMYPRGRLPLIKHAKNWGGVRQRDAGPRAKEHVKVWKRQNGPKQLAMAGCLGTHLMKGALFLEQKTAPSMRFPFSFPLKANEKRRMPQWESKSINLCSMLIRACPILKGTLHHFLVNHHARNPAGLLIWLEQDNHHFEGLLGFVN